jgi:hypothetical protein
VLLPGSEFPFASVHRYWVSAMTIGLPNSAASPSTLARRPEIDSSSSTG